MAKSKTCECGCGKPTIRDEARFLPGHDAKLKSQLIRTILGRVAKGQTPPTPAQVRTALERIRALGWESHLEVSRNMDARKAKRAANVKGTAARNAERADKAPAKPRRVTKAPEREGDVRTPAGGTVPASVGKLQHATA